MDPASDSDRVSAAEGAAAWFGRCINVAARWSRELLFRRGASHSHREAPLHLAVLCDAFIRYGSAQAIGLRATGVSVTFYYVDRLGEFDGDIHDRQRYLDRVTDAGIEIVPLPQRQLGRLPLHIRSLYRDIVARRIDALIVHQHIDPRYATLGLRFPVALYVHDPKPHTGDYASTYPAPVRLVSRFAQMTADCLILHSPRLRPQLPPVLRHVPTGYVPHGAEMAASPCPLRSPPVIVLVGRLMAYKGVDVALAAFGLVVAKRPECTMVVAGRGRLGDEIRAASPLGVELRDRYIPELELAALLDGARLVLLPYRDATQSGVGLLAIARGVPCIVSDVGALPELVPPGYDWVVPPEDPGALGAAILKALDHPSDTRQELFDFAADEFSWLSVGGQLLREIERLRLATD
jgi:glycosyltransferase involved in cell wall biosynthesis